MSDSGILPPLPCSVDPTKPGGNQNEEMLRRHEEMMQNLMQSQQYIISMM
jgi:hypothetical protein